MQINDTPFTVWKKMGTKSNIAWLAKPATAFTPAHACRKNVLLARARRGDADLHVRDDFDRKSGRGPPMSIKPHSYSESPIYTRLIISTNKPRIFLYPISFAGGVTLINTSYQKLPFGSGDDPDKLRLRTNQTFMSHGKTRGGISITRVAIALVFARYNNTI